METFQPSPNLHCLPLLGLPLLGFPMAMVLLAAAARGFHLTCHPLQHLMPLGPLVLTKPGELGSTERSACRGGKYIILCGCNRLTDIAAIQSIGLVPRSARLIGDWLSLLGVGVMWSAW
jgi:hypothetical protein